ncbi:MAG: hypothetical protein K2X69_00950 [Silvanigrellaceae bacterium]|nr:hypothetical protein [Silvanigrellaceae bacterium]
METQIIEFFCIIDDFLKVIDFKDDRQAKMSSAEIITTVIAAAWYFSGNHEKARRFFYDFKMVKSILHKGQFNRRLHAISLDVWESINSLLAQIFKNRNISQEYTIDSFPVAVCKNIRISRCSIYSEEMYRGWNESKKEYFLGLRFI